MAFLATTGNLAVLVCFARERRLRRRLTNYYILSLAVADLLVGSLAIPFAVLTRVGLPHDSPLACVAMLSFIVVLCTVSILHLVAVSVDRYWAILYPLAYQRLASEGVVVGVVFACWLAGFMLGFLPLLGWHDSKAASSGACLFLPVMKYSFLVFLYFATIVYPALLIAFFYVRIYSVVRKQLRQITVFGDSARNDHLSTPSRGNNNRSDEALCSTTFKETPNLSEMERYRPPGADFHDQSPQQSPANHKCQGHNCQDEAIKGVLFSPPKAHPDNSEEQRKEKRGGRTVNGHVGVNGRLRSNQMNGTGNHDHRLHARRQSDSEGSEHHCLPLHVGHHHSQQHKREVRTAKALLSIVLFFMICWFPLYTLNCVKAFCFSCDPPVWLFDGLIILSHMNSALNPLLYAYRMTDFRDAFKRLLRCKSPAPAADILLFYRNAGTPPIHRTSDQGCHRVVIGETFMPVL